MPDNVIFVRQISPGKWAVWEDRLSALLEGRPINAPLGARTYGSRADALVAAHDLMRNIGSVEYGVREVSPLSPAQELVWRIRRFLETRQGIAGALERAADLLKEAALLLEAMDLAERR
jgi:hypothetical protein